MKTKTKRILIVAVGLVALVAGGMATSSYRSAKSVVLRLQAADLVSPGATYKGGRPSLQRDPFGIQPCWVFKFEEPKADVLHYVTLGGRYFLSHTKNIYLVPDGPHSVPAGTAPQFYRLDTAATCTPSRYSLLTGAYPWRNPRAAILACDAPSIIDPETPTLPGMLRKADYATGVVGKWHLGLGKGDLNWNREISITPNDAGFDYSFIMAATNDRVPCVYVENREVVGLDPDAPIEVTYDWDKAFADQPTGRNNPELLTMKYSHGHDGTIINGVSRIGHMRGGETALWDDETMAEVFVEKAINFVTEKKDQPFFLYYALHQPHVPRLPAPRFKGATPHGPRGDVIVEMDWCLGELLSALDQLGITENTVIIFSSDNGPELDDGYQDQAEELNGSHRAAGPLRGGKYTLFDGGTRVPFILSWPGTVQPGASDAIVSHVDFHASLASMLDQGLSVNEAPDSMDVLDALLGKSAKGRDELVVEGTQGRHVLRQHDWVFIPPHKSPWGKTGAEVDGQGNSMEPQLYDLSQDIGQIRNIAAEHEDIVVNMSARLNETISGEGTRPF
jgi:arylsulfatase A-like enzyme